VKLIDFNLDFFKKCDKVYTENDLIIINPNQEEIQLNKKKLLARKEIANKAVSVFFKLSILSERKFFYLSRFKHRKQTSCRQKALDRPRQPLRPNHQTRRARNLQKKLLRRQPKSHPAIFYPKENKIIL
jgi:hypothetical protein